MPNLDSRVQSCISSAYTRQTLFQTIKEYPPPDLEHFLAPDMILVIFLFSLTLAQPELKFVQVIFRHGDRAPLEYPYPKDPYTLEAWRRGWGQVTTVGDCLWSL